MITYPEILPNQLDDMVKQSAAAFRIYHQYSITQRIKLLDTISVNLEKNAQQILAIAEKETHLSKARLKSELTRTCWQLNSYASYCKTGQWLDIRIDTKGIDKQVSHIRKMQIPLGPVAVFGAANFPLAYSTAGGDTACALAAGCTVIVKAHPGHSNTSQLIAGIISATLAELHMEPHIFQHLHGSSHEIGKALVMHPLLKAVGFTGSQKGGKQIFDWGQQRPEPIPVFAEMSSVNPVFILPEKLKTEAEVYAKLLADSISTSAGQFCTCPGIIIGINSKDFDHFIHKLAKSLSECSALPMLNNGIFENYQIRKQNILNQPAIEEIKVPNDNNLQKEVEPALAIVDANEFMDNPQFMQEVFGPFSLIVKCNNYAEMLKVSQSMEGQLTATIIADENELIQHKELIDNARSFCGRLIFNGVPTGVQVSLAMQHGGPFPATTDSRFTAVGGDGMKRFTRPIAYQNWPNNLLPAELKNENPLKIWRTINTIPGIH